MSDRPRDWLPTQASTRPAVRARVDAAVAAWSQAWMAGDGVRLDSWELLTAVSPSAEAWRSYDGGLEVSCSPHARLRLALAALGTSTDGVELTDRDGVLLSALGERMVGDLVRRLRELLGVERDGARAGEPRVVARLTDRVDVLLAISAPLSHFPKLVRQALPAPKALSSRPTARTASIGEARVRLEATLGGVSLDLVQLRGLAVGDVLVLDKALDEPVEVSIAGVPIGHGALGEADGRSVLILQTAE